MDKITTNKSLKDRMILWAFPILVGLLSFFFQLTGLDTELRFSRHDIEAGQWWLLITGNLVHLGWGHFVLNLAGLMMVWWFFFDDFVNTEWLFIFLLSSLFVTVGIYYRDTYLIWYVGLSGLLHGLFLAGGLKIFHKERVFASVFLISIIGKLIYEQLFGSVPGTAEMSGGPVIVNAHLYGAIGGVVAYIMLLLFKYITSKQS